MAPGVDRRPLRTRQIGDLIVFEPNLDTRRMAISEPSMAIERRKDASARFGKYSTALIMCAGAAMFALAALYLVDDPRQFRAFMTTMPSSPEAFTGERPRLLVQAQNGLTNEPLPLGVAVEHESDGGTVTIEGLPNGADLWLGSRLERYGWTLAAADLEQTFVGAPTDFVGIMEPTAALRSASGKLLDRQALHFEWRARKGEPSDKSPGETTNSETASVGTAAATPTVSSSPPQPALALPPPASPPDTVGHASGSEAVASKRGARLKGPHGKRSNALVHPDQKPTVSIFDLSQPS